ncbi:MAG: hypothetical protein ACI9UK_001168 [Candidatus Krumholzibacteriia bacterium]|jgi:hypothetical protein
MDPFHRPHFKQCDDLMAATRYAVMMIRHAKTGKQVQDWYRPIQYPPRYFANIV